MSLDDALFLVDRGGTNYHSKGSDIGDRMVAGDIVLVQRSGQRFKATYDGNEWSTIRDSDLLLAWDGTNNRRVTGASFKSLFIVLPPPIAEWNWRGLSSNFDDTKMCDKSGTSFTWTSNSVTYFADTDRNGNNIINTVTDAYNEKGTLWYKHNDSPAFSVPSGRPPQYGPAYCHYVHNGVGINGPSASGGVLRCYDYNPDA